MNALGQRTNVANSGTAFGSVRDITWGYDSLGQVVSADSTIPGLDRAYQFDLIGNRLRAATGSIDVNDPTATVYSPNALNQYSQITHNALTNNPEYDSDGNATAYPLPANASANSALTWDAENRLIEVQVGTSGPLVRYFHDAQSRRIATTVGTGGPAGPTLVYVYDGWNCIAEYSIQNSTFSIQHSYLWGLDLSGSLQGAGGVGGLLSVSRITNNPITSNIYYPTYDGNGNVSEYLDIDGAIVAHYEYDPFGNTTIATGSKAQDFAHRFSTKPLDATTGLYYYGYRYYDPNTGRWPSRDPIGERGGLNLYGFAGNDGVGRVDVLGEKFEQMQTLQVQSLEGAYQLGVAPSRAFLGAKCECNSSSKWSPKLVRFWVQAYIVVRTHIYKNGVYYNLTSGSMNETIDHEQKHVDNFKKWHDNNEAKAKKDFSSQHIFDSKKDCSDYIDSKEYSWTNSYYRAVRDEVRHKNGPYGGGSKEVVNGPSSGWEAPPDPYDPSFSNRLRFKNYTEK